MIDTLFLKAQLSAGTSPAGRWSFLSLTPPGGWPRRDEFGFIYQSDSTDFVDSQIIYTCTDNVGSVEVPVELAAESTYYFAFQNIGLFGQASELSSPLVVVTDFNGNSDLAVGNIPRNLTAALLSGGRIKLSWHYDRTGEPESPDGFSIERHFAGQWQPQDTVSAQSYKSVYLSQRNYAWISTSIGHGTATAWRIRAFRAVNENIYYGPASNTVEVITDSEGPMAVTNLRLG